MHELIKLSLESLKIFRRSKHSLEDLEAKGLGLWPNKEPTEYIAFNDDAFARLSAGWILAGMNVFNLSPQLLGALLMTKLPTSEKTLNIQLPYKAQYLLLPPEFLPFREVKGEPTEWITFIGTHKTHRYIGRPLVCILGTSSGYFSGAAFSTIFFPSDLNRGSIPSVVSHGDQPDGTYVTNKTLNLVIRILANFGFWLDASGSRDTVKKKKTKAQQKRRDKGKWPEIWLVGKKVSLSSELMDVAKDIATKDSGAQPRKGWQQRVQHLVRGHWKMQSHGPSSSLRKRLWVEPYMRGPEGKVAWAHIYQDGDKHAEMD